MKLKMTMKVETYFHNRHVGFFFAIGKKKKVVWIDPKMSGDHPIQKWLIDMAKETVDFGFRERVEIAPKGFAEYVGDKMFDLK